MTDVSHLRAQVEILRWARRKRAEIAEVEAKAKAEIQDAMGDDDVALMDGEIVVTWKAHKRRALDQSYLKSHFPEAHAESVATTEVRRFEVCE